MYGAKAASFCLEPEPTHVGWSQSRSQLQDLGHQEPEPPKKVVAPQHCTVYTYGKKGKIFNMKETLQKEYIELEAVLRIRRFDHWFVK